MLKTTLLLLGIAVSAGLTGNPGLGWQHPAARPAYDPNARVSTNAIQKEIHVDQRCRILPSPDGDSTGKTKPKPKRDPVVCHIETIHDSEHVEERVSGGFEQRNYVRVAEQEYLLQDVMDEPVTFVVEQPVRKDWKVDSDPQPIKLVGSEVLGFTALFRVYAQPGETVRLHVGMRHTVAGKAKPVHAS